MHDADGVEEDEQDKREGEGKGGLKEKLNGGTEKCACQSLQILWRFNGARWEVRC